MSVHSDRLTAQHELYKDDHAFRSQFISSILTLQYMHTCISTSVGEIQFICYTAVSHVSRSFVAYIFFRIISAHTDESFSPVGTRPC